MCHRTMSHVTSHWRSVRERRMHLAGLARPLRRARLERPLFHLRVSRRKDRWPIASPGWDPNRASLALSRPDARASASSTSRPRRTALSAHRRCRLLFVMTSRSVSRSLSCCSTSLMPRCSSSPGQGRSSSRTRKVARCLRHAERSFTLSSASARWTSPSRARSSPRGPPVRCAAGDVGSTSSIAIATFSSRSSRPVRAPRLSSIVRFTPGRSLTDRRPCFGSSARVYRTRRSLGVWPLRAEPSRFTSAPSSRKQPWTVERVSSRRRCASKSPGNFH